MPPAPTPAARPETSRSSLASSASLWGASGVMFLSFVGFSEKQFHGYLFERLGFTPLQIGLLLGAGYAAGLVAPLAQVFAIRKLRGPRRPLLLALLGAGLGALLLPHAGTFGAAALLFFASLLCSSSINPLNAACTLEVTRTRGAAWFFVIRCVGTAGYLVGCILSWMQPNPDRLPWLYAGFGLAFLWAIPVAARYFRPEDPRQAPEDILVTPNPRRAPGFKRAWRLLSAPRARRLLLTLGAMNFANAMATLVQGNYLVSQFGGGQRSISMAWIVSTACEIPLMFGCVWLIRRGGLRWVLGFGLIGTTLKLVMLGMSQSYGMYLLGLAFHGCFYAGALGGFNLFLDQRYSVADRPTLQALGALFYTGLPSALGGLTAGVIWHLWGLHAVFATAALISLAVGGYAIRLLPQLPGRKAPAR